MKKSLFLLIIIPLLAFLFASFKLSDSNSDLFNIERSKDENEIHYEVNVDKLNKLNSENPITIYWVKKTKGNKIKPLTWIQKKYAYGLKYINKTETFAEFQFVSYSKRNFEIRQNKRGVYKVYTLFGNKEVEVNHIFIQIDGGTFWFPKISKVELSVTGLSSDKTMIKTIVP